MSSVTAAALVGAGLASVLVFPSLALSLVRGLGPILRRGGRVARRSDVTAITSGSSRSAPVSRICTLCRIWAITT
jgi:hypothetical protein